ncbi:MAG: biosynthetic-type acetolactate synthase large subunit [Clostridioides sp.]|jgi:acetolactate synthase-1/2/3 large subunit|nr:biosynthetic-type acetolactate synthase large subunit [Clostridioides sp.]
MKMNGAEIVIETLIDHGVKDVFGFPGGTVLHIYDALYKYSSKINHYITCHEQGAAHAADGYARSTGNVGVVIATSGPGATNLITGIATAYLDSTPLISITGNVSLDLIGKDSFQEVDITGVTMPITKHNFMVKSIEELEDILCEAFEIATSGRPGPVLIDIPKNIQAEVYEYKGKVLNKRILNNKEISLEKLERIAKIINESKKPYIYCGGGIILSNSSNELVELAEKIDSPIGCSIMGLSAINSKHPLALGMTGMHGTYASSKINSEADVIIGVGVRFSDRATGDKNAYSAGSKIIHIDIDNAELNKNISSSESINGNIKDILPELIKLVDKKKNPKWQEKIQEYKKVGEKIQFINEFNPKEIIKTVKKYAPNDTIITTDVGQHQMWTAQYYPFEKPRTFITSGGLGTMGFGVGAAIGASIANNKAKTLLFTGDGSFHMNLNEISTAVLHELPIVVIILNNNVLGMVRQWQELFYENRCSETLITRKTDFLKLAEAFGADGYNATNYNELNSALEVAFQNTKPTIINCLIGNNENVFPMVPPGKSIENMIIN